MSSNKALDDLFTALLAAPKRKSLIAQPTSAPTTPSSIDLLNTPMSPYAGDSLKPGPAPSTVYTHTISKGIGKIGQMLGMSPHDADQMASNIEQTNVDWNPASQVDELSTQARRAVLSPLLGGNKADAGAAIHGGIGSALAAAPELIPFKALGSAVLKRVGKPVADFLMDGSNALAHLDSVPGVGGTGRVDPFAAPTTHLDQPVATDNNPQIANLLDNDIRSSTPTGTPITVDFADGRSVDSQMLNTEGLKARLADAGIDPATIGTEPPVVAPVNPDGPFVPTTRGTGGELPEPVNDESIAGIGDNGSPGEGPPPEFDTRPLSERGTTPPVEPPTPSEKLLGILTGAKGTLAEQEAIRAGERSAKVKASAEAGRTADEGGASYLAQRGALKGPLTKLTAGDIRSQFTQEDLDGLFRQIDSHPGFKGSFYDSFNARTGLIRLLDGDLPRPSELKLLEQAMDAPTLKALLRNRAELKKAFSGEYGQAEMFPGEETISKGPLAAEPLPEPKVRGRDYMSPADRRNQASFIEPRPWQDAAKPNPFTGEGGQAEMFKPGETLSTSPEPGVPLAPEPKPVDPNAFVKDKMQGDFFEKKPAGFDKPFAKGRPIKPQSLLSQIFGLSRSMVSTWDVSAPFNQGWNLVTQKQFWNNYPKMIQAFASKKVADEVMPSIVRMPLYPEMKKAGVFFADHENPSAAAREEMFPSPLAEKIPVFGQLAKMSNRAHSSFLNKLRADTFNRAYEKAAALDPNFAADPAALKALGTWVNAASGRGKLGPFEPAANVVNSMFFGPRLQASRVNLYMNPMLYANLPEGARAYAIANTARTIAATKAAMAGGAAGLAAVGLGAAMEWDPRSSDYGKMQVGNSKLSDPSGLDSWVTMLSRVGAGVAHNVFGADIAAIKNSKGELKNLGDEYGSRTPLQVFEDFITNKLSPNGGLIRDLLKGKDFSGNPVTAGGVAAQLTVPMSVQNAFEAIKGNDNKGVGAAVTALGATGLNFYTPDPLPPAPTTIKVDGQSVQLDGEDRVKYQEVVRQHLLDELKPTKDSGEWAKMDKYTQAQLVAQIVTEGKKLARASLFDLSDAQPQPPAAQPTAPQAPTTKEPSFEGFPGIVTSMGRTKEHNEKVGGVENSDHLSGDAVDFKPPKGWTMDELTTAARAYFGDDKIILNEGDSIHVRIPGLHADNYSRPSGQ